MSAISTVRGIVPGQDSVIIVGYTDSAIVAVDPERRRTGEVLPALTPGFIDLQVNGYAGLDVNGKDVPLRGPVRPHGGR